MPRARLRIVNVVRKHTMGTEKNQANVAPIPAPPVTPAVPGPPTLVGGGVALSPSSGRGKKMMLIGILVGVLIVLGDCWRGWRSRLLIVLVARG